MVCVCVCLLLSLPACVGLLTTGAALADKTVSSVQIGGKLASLYFYHSDMIGLLTNQMASSLVTVVTSDCLLIDRHVCFIYCN